MTTTRPLTAVHRKGAWRLFDTIARRTDRALGRRAYDVCTIRAVESGEEVVLAQSWSDGRCEYTLQLTARRQDD